MRTLKIMPRNLSTKFYVNEYGFSLHRIIVYILQSIRGSVYSSELGPLTPSRLPSPQRCVAPLPLGPWGRHARLRLGGRGGGGWANSVEGRDHSTVHRVPEFLAGRLNWHPPPLPPQTSVSPQNPGGGTHTRMWEWGGGANSDEGTGTLALCVLYCGLSLLILILSRSFSYEYE